MSIGGVMNCGLSSRARSSELRLGFIVLALVVLMSGCGSSTASKAQAKSWARQQFDSVGVPYRSITCTSVRVAGGSRDSWGCSAWKGHHTAATDPLSHIAYCNIPTALGQDKPCWLTSGGNGFGVPFK